MWAEEGVDIIWKNMVLLRLQVLIHPTHLLALQEQPKLLLAQVNLTLSNVTLCPK